MDGKVLVTGATGFIGSFVVESLLNQNIKVAALVRNMAKLRWLKKQGDIELIEGALENLTGLPKDITHIIHLAGLTKARSRKEYFEANVNSTEHLLKLVKNQNLYLKRFLLVSSQAASGPSKINTVKKEDDPPEPITWYGDSKLESEKLVWAQKNHYPVTIIRPPAVYGPRDRDVLNIFKLLKWGINIKIGKENQTVSMIYVKTLAAGIINALFHPNAENQLFFLTDSDDYRLENVIKLLANIMGKKYITFSIPFQLAYAMAFAIEIFCVLSGQLTILNRQKMIEFKEINWLCSSQKAIDLIEFNAVYDLETALKETYLWYKQQDWL